MHICTFENYIQSFFFAPVMNNWSRKFQSFCTEEKISAPALKYSVFVTSALIYSKLLFFQPRQDRPDNFPDEISWGRQVKALAQSCLFVSVFLNMYLNCNLKWHILIDKHKIGYNILKNFRLGFIFVCLYHWFTTIKQTVLLYNARYKFRYLTTCM